MGETANQIETHIESTRQDLASNLRQLEHKVKAVTDWKHHFRNSPMTAVGIAFGGGIVLATMIGGRQGKRPQRLSGQAGNSEPYGNSDRPRNKAMETWDGIKGALIGVAATRFKDFVGEVVPGFQDQFHRTQREYRDSLPVAGNGHREPTPPQT